MTREQTFEKLYRMKLHGMAKALEEQMTQPDMADLSFEERFAMMVDAQWTWRENRSLATRLSAAKERGALMTRTHSKFGWMRSICVVLALIGNLPTAPTLFAASPQPPDDAHRLYDRVMEEFRHKDYAAALAGFRFSSNFTGNPRCPPTLNIGKANASTAWDDTRTRWTRSTTSSATIR